MKKGRVFAAIIYYLFTFSLGILMALFLPYLLYFYSESVNYIQDELESGNYANALSIVGGYYDDRYVFEQKFDGGGIVLFTAITLEEGVDAEGEVLADRYVRNSYAGFLYGAGDYLVTKTEDNKTKIIVVDIDGAEHSVEILNTNTDGDDNDTKDTVATLLQNSFLFVDLTEEVKSIARIKFVDCDGDIYQQFEIETPLDFGEKFFEDVKPFVELYNAERPDTEEGVAALENELAKTGDAFLALDEHYKMSTDGVVQSKADTKSAIIVVVYFVAIYIIGDFLVGGRYILKFFKFLNRKVFKIKINRKAPKYKEAFGHDYFCKVTLSADVSEADDFNESVQVRYSNENGEIEFSLLKSNGYKQTLSVKAGDYVNLWVDINTDYATQDLPDTLEVEGFQKEITFKIIKREKFKSEE